VSIPFIGCTSDAHQIRGSTLDAHRMRTCQIDISNILKNPIQSKQQ
jgi:hypothetical protein